MGAPASGRGSCSASCMNASYNDRLRKQLEEARKSEPETATLRKRINALEQERAQTGARNNAAAKAAKTKAAKARRTSRRMAEDPTHRRA